MTDFEREVIDRLGHIDENLKALNKAIYGNGKPGLVDVVHDLDKRVNVLEEKRKSIYVAIGIILSLLASIGALLK